MHGNGPLWPCLEDPVYLHALLTIHKLHYSAEENFRGLLVRFSAILKPVNSQTRMDLNFLVNGKGHIGVGRPRLSH